MITVKQAKMTHRKHFDSQDGHVEKKPHGHGDVHALLLGCGSISKRFYAGVDAR